MKNDLIENRLHENLKRNFNYLYYILNMYNINYRQK